MLAMTKSSVPAAWALICLAGVGVLGIGVAQAKLETITLSQLVNEADLVFYGQTTQHKRTTSERDHSVAWIKPLSVLKNKTRENGAADIPICNGGDAEQVDFISNPGSYVVFVSKEGSCYAPIAGFNSVVLVKDKIVHSGRIEGQPREQGLAEFVEQVRALLQAQ